MRQQSPTPLLLLLAFLVSPIRAQDGADFRHITTADGLNSSSVISMAVDHQGFMWIGTSNGANRHDGARMLSFYHDPVDSTSIPDARVDAIRVMSNGDVYVGTQNGAARFEPSTRTFRRLPLKEEQRVVVHDLDELPSGEILLSTWQHGLIRFDPESWTVRKESVFTDRLDDRTIRNVLLSDSTHAWISRYRGLYRVNLDTGLNEMPAWPQPTISALNEAVIFRMVEHQGRLWLATTNGVWSINLTDGDLRYFEAWGKQQDPYARFLFVDSRSILWAGAHGGLAYYDSATQHFTPIRHVTGRASSILPGSVHAIAQDRSGVLWVGSDERGVSLFDLYSRNATHIESRLDPTTNMPEGHTWSAAEAADGSIWIGMESDFGYWSQRDRRFVSVESPDITSSVTSVLIDSIDRIWVGTSSQGVCRYIRATNRCLPVLSDITTVYVLYEDAEDEIWVGTFTGLIHLNVATGATRVYRNESDNQRSLDSNLILMVRRDEAGRLWAGTESGLNRLDPVSNRFDRVLTNFPVFRIEPRPDGRLWLMGLDVSIFDPDNAQNHVLAPFRAEYNDGLAKSGIVDGSGDLWVNLTTSIAVLDQEGFVRAIYPLPEGRRSFEFPVTAVTRTRDGTILLGVEDGFALFEPNSLVQNPFPPLPEFSGATVDGAFIPLIHSSGVTVDHNNRVLTVEFSAPHFSDHLQTVYDVRLSPLEAEWRRVEAPQVSFTSLPPGDYMLDVRATTSNGRSGTTTQPLSIRVTPPWWSRSWVILLMVISGVSVLYMTFWWRTGDLQRQNVRLDSEVNRRTQELSQKASELEVANQTKSRFFSNVSHELRTPLTLIKGYLEEAQAGIDRGSSPPHNRQRIVRASGLVDRMDDMVGQLLDLARTDNNRLVLNGEPADMSSFVARVVNHFQIAARRKFIDLTFETDPGTLVVMMDPVKMDQIVSNLINNAIKFTPAYGAVYVTLAATDSHVTLVVADTGPGITKEEQPRIFERFYQVQSELTRNHEGLGIGLALTSDLVRLHGGAIDVSSVAGEGAVFSVRLDRVAPDTETVFFHESTAFPRDGDVALSKSVPDEASRPRLLVVEDNPELRRHIRETLVDLFEIIEASDGAEGWKAVQLRSPDLVLSDVMMPGMSGLDLLAEIRNSERFQDMPVVFLTARSGDEAQAESLEARVDDFIPKPFNRRVLRARLLNLARRQDEWTTATDPGATGLQEDQADFLELARDHVRANLKDVISVATLAEATHTSERTLQRRIKEIVGVTAGAFVRMERLEVARSLLERGDVRSVSHAAQETGFGNVSHFSKVFEEQFGINPKTYME